jgi:hypothetical protein
MFLIPQTARFGGATQVQIVDVDQIFVGQGDFALFRLLTNAAPELEG